MNSRVIKCVAGAGKTYLSREYLKAHGNGLYLAFTNSVIEDISCCGAISRTVDSLFISFLFPKIIAAIPLIARGSDIEYITTATSFNPIIKNIGKIHIDRTGAIYSGNREMPITLETPNEELHRMTSFPNLMSLRAIFGKQTTQLTDSLRDNLMAYIIYKYPEEILYFMSTRFHYVIFDEAQDLGGSREEFAKLLYDSNIPTIFLGDDFQKIMPGSGNWFEGIEATESQLHSKRCPEDNCRWIRENLGIEIYGDSDKTGGVEHVHSENISPLDDGTKMLLYHARKGKLAGIIDNWTGPKSTIGKIKGRTVDTDVIIVGESLNKRSYYVAITRTTGKVFSMIKTIKA